MFWIMNDEPISIEAEKLRFEFFKHLTRLSLGMIVGIGGLTTILPSAKCLWLVVLAAALLLVSIFGSLLGMLWKAEQVGRSSKLKGTDKKDLLIGVNISIGCFVSAIAASLFFFWLNLIPTS